MVVRHFSKLNHDAPWSTPHGTIWMCDINAKSIPSVSLVTFLVVASMMHGKVLTHDYVLVALLIVRTTELFNSLSRSHIV